MRRPDPVNTDTAGIIYRIYKRHEKSMPFFVNFNERGFVDKAGFYSYNDVINFLFLAKRFCYFFYLNWI